MSTLLIRLITIQSRLLVSALHPKQAFPKLVLLVWVSCLLANCAGAFPDSVTLQCAELKESSGLAVSGYDANFIWTHNDSGGKPQLYLFDRANGSLCRQIELAGVTAIDWEDMCSFQINGKRYLAVGDIGDNARKRKNVLIHVVEEPPLARGNRLNDQGQSNPVSSVESFKADSSALALQVSTIMSLEVVYPDGPMDCESLVFDAQLNRFLLLSKEWFRCRIFGVPLDLELLHPNHPVQSQQKINVRADYVQSVGIPLATAADYCPVSQRLVVCTYRPAYLMERDGQEWSEKKMKMVSLPNRRQGEAIAFAGVDSLLVTSEFAPTPLWTVTIPSHSKEK